MIESERISECVSVQGAESLNAYLVQFISYSGKSPLKRIISNRVSFFIIETGILSATAKAIYCIDFTINM